MQWLSAHDQIISLIVSALTLLVWVFYAHLLLNNYRRQRRPKILINMGVSGGLDSRCLICNMSEEAIYVTLVVAELHTAKGKWECNITDFVQRDDPARSILDETTQGPMKAGEFRDQQSFRTQINRVLHAHGMPEIDENGRSEIELQRLSVHVVAIYGSEDLPVGASRHFNLVEEDDGYRLNPTTAESERLSSLAQRRQITKWLERYL